MVVLVGLGRTLQAGFEVKCQLDRQLRFDNSEFLLGETRMLR